MSSSRDHVSFTGCADGFGRFHRFDHKIGPGFAPEAAAEIRGVDEYVLRLQSANFRGGALRHGLKLRGCPDVHAIRANIGRAIDRLHGGVRQVGGFVDRFNLLRGSGQRGCRVAFLAGLRAGFRHLFREKFADVLTVGAGVRTFVPFDFKHAPPLHRRPGIVSDHRNSAGDFNHVT